MKRILLITENLGSGGAERQLCGLAAMLTEAGYPCRVITYNENQFYLPYLKEKHVDYQFVPPLANRFLRIPRLVRYIRGYKPDVVISFLGHVNVYLCAARLFCRFKLIVSERNNHTSLSLSDRLTFNLYRMADYVVPNSCCEADFIRSHCTWLSGKVVPVTNFVDTGKFVPPATQKNNDKPLKILTLARYSEQKNVLRFLEAVRLVKDAGLKVRFEWYGNIQSYSNLYKQAIDIVMALKIEDCITLNDESEDVVSLYQNTDIFCLPSLFEGYPNVVVEAMSCGLPVICSNVCENPEIITEGINGFLFDPYDSENIALAIRTIAGISDSERTKIGNRNRDKCFMTNSIDKFLERYIKLIEQ